MTLSQKEIESELLSITQQMLSELQAERALQAISLNASFDRDLGMDSLGKVELFQRVEKAFAVQLPVKAMAEVENLQGLVSIIQKSPSIQTPEKKAQTYVPKLEAISLNLEAAKTYPEVLLAYVNKEPMRPQLYLQNEMGEEKVITYGELFSEAQKVAQGLYNLGIQPGEAIAIMLPTSDEFFFAFLGVLLLGAVPVPIYPPFRPDRIEEYAKREAKILHNAQARILITFTHAAILSNILQPFIPSLKAVVTLKNLQAKVENLPSCPTDADDPALIQYTSGSTGDPKGVLLHHKNILANIRAIGKGLHIKPNDVAVSWLPLYHDMGLMSWLTSLYFGAPITILSPLTFLTRPERWLWTIHYHRATVSGGPNFGYELCAKKIKPTDIEGLDLSSWNYAFSGAEPISPKTLERFSKKFAPFGFKKDTFAPVYGLAEGTVGLTFPPKSRPPLIDKIERHAFEKDHLAIPTQKKDFLEFVACGQPLEQHEIRIVDDSGNPLKDRTVGNLQFKGPSSMQGYFNNVAATQKIYHNGWWETGDLGYIAEGDLYITGRKKDLIIKAGRNLYPQEVEEIVGLVPGIRKGCVAAFGVHDNVTATEKLIVVAETYEQNKQAQQKIRQAVIENMGISLGIPPDGVILVPPKTIPKTSSGKLQRSACKQAYVEKKLVQTPLPVKVQFAKLATASLFHRLVDWMHKLGKVLYLFYLVIVVCFTLPFVWLSLFIFPTSIAREITRFSARLFSRLAGCPVTIEGKSNLEETHPVIFVSNHASYIDSILLLGILPSGVLFTTKKELLTTPIMRSFVKKLGFLTVDRMDFIKSLENKKQIEASLTKGNSIVIFPEGTFTYATGLRPFKLGAFTLAAETQTPICPIAIQGTRTILRGDTLLPKPGKIKVTVGKPIIPQGKDWNEIMRLHSAVRSEIAKNCGEPVIDLVIAGPVVD